MKNRVILCVVTLLVLLSMTSAVGCKPPQAVLEASVTSGQAPLTVSFTNKTEKSLLEKADEFQWDFGDGATMTTSTAEESVTHDFTKAGNYTVTLTAIKKGEPPKTTTMNLNITVEHGPLDHVKLSPETVELDIGQSQEFTVDVVDAYGNPITKAQLTWEAAEEAGSITDKGILTGGTKASSFAGGVVVTAELNARSAKAVASVTIKPDPLDSVRIAPIEVAAGETQQLEAITTDQYGNRVQVEDTIWAVTDENAGSITQAGLLTAGEVVMTFADSAEVEVRQGERVRTAVASVTITPGPLEQVVIAPKPVEVGMEMTQQFVAVGADQYGNRISGLAFNWSVEEGGGTIDKAGLFTAGTKPGTYKNTVRAEATQGGVTRSATTDVTVEPDRVAFWSYRNDEQWDIYIMNIDGTDVERLTNTTAEEMNVCCSPDGRRIAYVVTGEDGGLWVMNDDGDYQIRLIDNTPMFGHACPAWSPDGSKIAFIKMRMDRGEVVDANIFTIDVDGGNLTQLTDNSAIDRFPSWSPDGTEILFDSERDGNFEIYIMNANGTNQRRLTRHSANDIRPELSPDGTEILFQSGRGGGGRWGIYIMDTDGTDVRPVKVSTDYSNNYPYWSPDGTRIVFHSWEDPDQAEIYIMDRDGSNVTRLTNNSANDYGPLWLPRKSGVEVTEASVVIPDASTLKAMTAQELTARASQAVVRIKTDLGSGSGFIIDADGLILTANHVICDAEEITVYLDDGTEYTGTVRARDLVHDLALVEIKASGLPYLELGDISQASLGQQVIVLGYPLEKESVVVTSGLVSAIEYEGGRNITWVQTDSAMNWGNSGGPVLNLQGQVIGVVCAKRIQYGVEGIGYAISVRTVNTYLPKLMAGENVP